MIKVLTYGTYDLLHHGHIKLLERAKALGDYLIVGVTADDFDKKRGKLNVSQSLMERVEAVRQTCLADEIIIEEYEGQKIDDIKKYDVDIFTVGTDWEGTFDYLNEYCKVIYLPRTEGVSSSEIRTQRQKLKVGIVGEHIVADKFENESKYVNGIEIYKEINENNDEHMEKIDAAYLLSHPKNHSKQIKKLIEKGKHVLCESPVALSVEDFDELVRFANERKLILMDGIKTAYSTAYNRMILIAKSGKIGKILSVDATCTSMNQFLIGNMDYNESWNSICAWGPTAMLPIFQLLGTNYIEKTIISKCAKGRPYFDEFSKVNFIYSNATASIKVAKVAKSEGELIITGTKGYIYVPAPWWKTDYFEIRFENQSENLRHFYSLEGEGIRNEMIAFIKTIESGKDKSYINEDISRAICKIIEEFMKGNVVYID